MKKYNSSWLAVAAWMVVIFLFSAQTGNDSGDTSGTIVRWFLGLIYPGFDAFAEVRQAEILEFWHTLIRKGAHFTEYAVLAVLVANAIRPYTLPVRPKWLLPIGFSALYAVTDEIHQYFVPGRACSAVDVGIDTCGAIFGTGVFMLVVFLVSRRKGKGERKE